MIERSTYEMMDAEIDMQRARIAELEAENERLTKINATLMGDDEDAPRYTTKRLKHEVAKAVGRALAERAGGGGKQDAIDFLYKHGALTHVAAREAVELLTSNGFEISRRPE